MLWKSCSCSFQLHVGFASPMDSIVWRSFHFHTTSACVLVSKKRLYCRCFRTGTFSYFCLGARMQGVYFGCSLQLQVCFAAPMKFFSCVCLVCIVVALLQLGFAPPVCETEGWPAWGVWSNTTQIIIIVI